MPATTRVDFHSHSVHSDGTMTPRELAEYLAAAGVVVAALADHNSLDGQQEFRQALARREVGCITAVEITTWFEGNEAHLLAYGIDPTHPEMLATLAALRQATAHSSVQSVADSLRTRGSDAPNDTGNAVAYGRLQIDEAIALVHRAGGKAFLAHPLVLEPDAAKLEALLLRLQALGLDGIEAIYEPFSEEQRSSLRELAQRHNLLVSAGTDIHDRKTPTTAGIDMPTTLWKAFRDAVCDGNPPTTPAVAPSMTRRQSSINWRPFLFHFIFPTMLAIVLFITAVYVIILPTFEHSLLERKREMIHELTNSAWSILADCEREEKAGKLTREQAQAQAISRIESLRYGDARKDYFWLQDMTPRIIMHPYRKDLNGQDVSTFRDPRGVAIFVEFVELVQQNHEGYAQYVWQWNDDPKRLVPKESYVKGFQPWGWIIGTGIYIEDVKLEIKRIERSLTQTTLAITIIVVLLLLYVLFESMRLERERAEVEDSLRDSTERYRSLVEATTEGTLLVLEGRCRYANPIFLEMIGATAAELELLDLHDLFPATADNKEAWEQLDLLLGGEETKGGFAAVLRRRNGVLIECVLTPSRIAVAERTGFILMSRSIGTTPEDDDAGDQRQQQLRQVVDDSPVGIFRARPSARGTLMVYNRTTQRLLATGDTREQLQLALADVFHDATVYDEFLQELLREKSATRRLHLVSPELQRRTVAIVARLSLDEQGGARFIDGIVEDVTSQEQRETELEASVERLQTSLLFLHEPISRLEQQIISCPLQTPVSAVAALISEHNASAALIHAESGEIVGIVTDGDIRGRIVAAGVALNEPAYRIMSSPLVTIAARAVIYEALLLMEQHSIQHLAVTDDTGRIVGVIQNQELLQFRNYGPIVLTREVEEAATPEEVVASCRRVPGLARALVDCGAHPHLITRMITAVCNAATRRLVALAEQELGAPPVPYVFLALGSQGREEMTLSSDQDNAIVYTAPDEESRLRAEAYLPELGRYVCSWLARAGYSYCRGEVMAQNPQWCQPLTVWKKYFSKWIQHAEAQQLLEFTIFFDFTAVCGDAEIARELRQHVNTTALAHPAFYPQFAQDSLQFKPPTRLFGRIIGNEQPGQLDLKDAMIPIISFARLYALRQQVDANNTLDRLKALAEVDILPETSARELAESYDFLLRLRLRQQTETQTAGQIPDNTINLRRLSHAEQMLLNQSFAQIIAVQKRISYDFLGGTQ